MIVVPVFLFIGYAEIDMPVPAFWPFTRGGEAGFSARYFVLPEPAQGLDEVDFDAAPDATAELETLSWADGEDAFWDGGPVDNFAAAFAATLEIEEAGSYTFHLTSDDGSAMVLDGSRIIDNDGIHPMIEQSASVTLEAGEHEVEILYLEQAGRQGLAFDWTGPDTGGVRIPVGAPAPDAEAPAQGAVAPTPGASEGAVAEATPGPAPDLSWLGALPQLDAAPGCGFVARFFVLPSALPWQLSEIDFGAVPVDTATVASLDWPLGNDPYWSGGPADGFAAHFGAALQVETPGSYSFHLASDDGSALVVDGAPAIVNDGAHPTIEQVATLELEAGTHRLDIVYFERDGDQELRLDWSGSDTSGTRQPLSMAAEAAEADCRGLGG